MGLFRVLFVILSLLTLAAPAVHAQDNESLVKIRILPEFSSAGGGDEIWIGIEQSIKEGWHTYWKNPGDSGAKPNIEWQAPDGFSFSKFHWPTPEKLPYGPLLNYGYKDQVILLQKLQLPDILPDGPIAFNGSLDILVCEVECIPEFHEVSFTLNDPANLNEDNSAFLKTARMKVPQEKNWLSHFQQEGESFALTIMAPNAEYLNNIDPFTLEFFPEDWGIITNAAPAEVTLDETTIRIAQKIGERDVNTLETTPIVLAYQDMDGMRMSYKIDVWNKTKVPGHGNAATPETAAEDTILQDTNDGRWNNNLLVQAFIYAFLGGLVLNLMPCVFPVLSIKALKLLKISEKQPELSRKHGLAYTAGVIVSFWVIAGLLIVLQSSGLALGWGFQLQNPIVVAGLAYLLFIIGLNLAGMFEIANPFANTGNDLAQSEGTKGSFFTGVLATLVATPCSAPFMATAIGFAFTQPPLVNLLIFSALGFGLAFPFLLLAYNPALQAMMPKPGTWMVRFKELLAFPMFASAVWLIWVLAQQSGPDGAGLALMGMMLITFAIWMWRAQPQKGAGQLIVRSLSLVIISIGIGTLALQHNDSVQGAERSAKIDTVGDTIYGTKFGRAWSQDALEAALYSNRPVFVEMTAAWCITCKVNHTIAINVDTTKELFKEQNIDFLIGDWTNYDAEITKYLEKYGRNGVPIYVYYGAPNSDGQRPEPVILPQVLTPGILKDYLG